MLLKIWGFLCFFYYCFFTQSFQVTTKSELVFISSFLRKEKSATKKKRIYTRTQIWNYNNCSYRGTKYLFNRNGGEGVKHIEDKASELLQKSNYATEINGLFNILPLGYRVIEKIQNVINRELEKIPSHCLHLSILQNKKWWNMTNRSKLYTDEFLYVYKLKRTKNENSIEDFYGGKKKKLEDDGNILSPTCEELSLMLINRVFNEQICLKNLPILIHQFNYKFRNEKRMEKSLFKTKEFLMKDGYSFHANEKCLSEIYEQYKECYKNIFQQFKLNFHIVKKRKKDKMNALESHEFQVHCRDKKFREVAHIFKLGDSYSNKLNITYLNKKNEKQFLHMGCYGIGIYRLLYFLIDHFYDEDGIRMPEQVAPFTIYLISKNQKGNGSSTKIDTFLKNLDNTQKEQNNSMCIMNRTHNNNNSINTNINSNTYNNNNINSNTYNNNINSNTYNNNNNNTDINNTKHPSVSPSLNIRDIEYVLTLWLFNIFKNNNVDIYYDDTDLHFSKKLKYCDLIGIPNRIIINMSNTKEKIKLPYDFYNFIDVENDGNNSSSRAEKIISNKLFMLFKNVIVEYKNRFSNEVRLISVHDLLKLFKIV